ncbi:MAG TPA: carbohydrate kinase family protein [Candidatus Paceibacterota bacterium]|nr:carbohydrate kinase family protein [Candidatus Paceibacterota bacterium]
MEKEIDFVAIGDLVIDAFIRLNDAEIRQCINHERQELCISFGDKIPYESMQEIRAVGNGPNAAVAAARLGTKSALIAHVGKDVHGDGCIAALKKNNVDTHYVSVHDTIPTNYHYVLWYGVERTILVKHAAFPEIFPNFSTPPKMIYLTSLAAHTLPFHHDIVQYLIAHPEVKLVFQPGTFQIKFGTDALKEVYQHTFAFFCNLEEAKKILATEEKDVGRLLKMIHLLGPHIVCITDGMNGAYASDGMEAWFMPVYPHDAYERTGAGDAFSSTVSVALMMGKSLQEALTWGPINSMSVVQYVGAQEGLLSQEKLLKYLAEAPASYAPQPVF